MTVEELDAAVGPRDKDPELEAFLNEVTSEFRNEMEDLVEKYYSDEYFDALGGPEEMIHEVVPDLAWREWFNGTMIPARQMHYVFEQGDPYYRDRDILVGLGRQLRDEVKHANTLANIARRFGLQIDYANWEEWLDQDVAEALVAQNEAAMVPHRDGPQYSAAGMQCSTEIIAVHTLNRMADYVDDEYPNAADAMRETAADEADHVHVGRLVVHRFSNADEIPVLREITDTKRDRIKQMLQARYEQAMS